MPLGKIAQKKYFFKFLEGVWADSSEILLFDFSLQVGDSLKGYYATMGVIVPIVSSIGSIQIDNNWRRIINFANIDNDEGCFYFIEGIGSSFGFLDFQSCPPFEGTANLDCFKLKGDVKYSHSGSCSDYSFINTTPESTAEHYNLQVYPNPSNGQFTLTFETTQQHDVTLNVVDLAGRSIWGEKINGLNGKYNRTFGNTKLAAGVYMLNVTIDGQRSVRKLVVN